MKLTSIAVATALSLAAGASFAQPAPAPASGPQQQRMMMRQHMDPAQMAERHAQRMRDALQLRPDQEPALKALIAAMQPPAGGMAAMRGQRQAMAKLTTPERLDRMQAMMAQHEARFRQRADAIKRFYAQLTPAQQKAFDAMPMMDHGMMGGHGMGGMRGHGMKGHMMRGAPGAPPAPPPAR